MMDPIGLSNHPIRQSHLFPAKTLQGKGHDKDQRAIMSFHQRLL